MATTTTNYGLTKPVDTDYYNIAVFNNNADTIDTKLKEISDSVAKVLPLITHSKSGSIHTLSTSLTGQFTAKFNAAGDFAEGDTWQIGGVTYTATTQTGEAVGGGFFVSGAKGIQVEVDTVNHTLGFKSGGAGLPALWKDERTAEAFAAITKYDPILMQHYGSWDEGINKVADPAVLPATTAWGTAFSPDGVYLAVTNQTTSPFITIYKRDGDTFTKLTNPTTLPTGTAYGCHFSHDGVYLAVAHEVTPFITIYKRSGDTFTKLANPTTLPTGAAYGCHFSPDEVYLAVAHDGSPRVTIYKRSGDTFTKLANPATTQRVQDEAQHSQQTGYI